ncbi:MAG TPA: hypothetical protein VFR06_04225 [Gallionellaceae bacterium]|nr:hypothetical protein [Gallionellaceae bacterium]
MNGFMIPVRMLLAAGLSGRQPEPEPLRIDGSPWPECEPAYRARDLVCLNASQVVLNGLPSSNISLESFSNGSADIATLTLDYVHGHATEFHVRMSKRQGVDVSLYLGMPDARLIHAAVDPAAALAPDFLPACLGI